MYMRKRALLIALAVIGLGLIGTGLSTLYQQQDWQTTEITNDKHMETFKEYHGFPLSWYGYTQTRIWYLSHWNPPYIPPKVYWFSLPSFLLDTAFWIAISSIGCIAIIKSMNVLHKARASKNLSVINI
jgi:hypothetical protein